MKIGFPLPLLYKKEENLKEMCDDTKGARAREGVARRISPVASVEQGSISSHIPKYSMRKRLWRSAARMSTFLTWSIAATSSFLE